MAKLAATTFDTTLYSHNLTPVNDASQHMGHSGRTQRTLGLSCGSVENLEMTKGSRR